MIKQFFSASGMIAAALALAGAACAQAPSTVPSNTTTPMTPQPQIAGEPASPTEESSDALSAADQKAAPFPPGRYAAVVKRVCTECHNAKPVLDLKYTKEEATRYYRNMVGGDLNSEQAKQVVEYLSTTLGGN